MQNNDSYQDILSIAAVDPHEWFQLHKVVPRRANIEVNFGCPNTPKNIFPGFASFTRNPREWCIAKIPPTFSKKDVDFIIQSGYKQINACNTIPTDQGGLSGKDIIPYTIDIIKHIKQNHPSVTIIAGGGITSKDDVERYRDHGADHFSLGTICFTPWKIMNI